MKFPSKFDTELYESDVAKFTLCTVWISKCDKKCLHFGSLEESLRESKAVLAI